MDREDIKMLVKKWWDIYNDESLNYKGANVGEATDMLGAALSKAAGAVKYVPAPSAA
jgi:inositol 3-alpha-galactosyltransferase